MIFKANGDRPWIFLLLLRKRVAHCGILLSIFHNFPVCAVEKGETEHLLEFPHVDELYFTEEMSIPIQEMSSRAEGQPPSLSFATCDSSLSAEQQQISTSR